IVAPDAALRSGFTAHVDRRFAARDDGTVDGWVTTDGASLTAAADRAGGDFVAVAGATIDASGRAVVHDPAPGVRASAVGGEFGLAVTNEGPLSEPPAQGGSWRLAGVPPLRPSGFAGPCSRVGCAVGPLVGVGGGSEPGGPAADGGRGPRSRGGGDIPVLIEP